MEQPSGKTSQEQARESLIAISYSSPEEEELLPQYSSDVKIISSTNGVATKGGNTVDAEKLRSELISISYDESPDASSPQPNGICRG